MAISVTQVDLVLDLIQVLVGLYVGTRVWKLGEGVVSGGLKAISISIVLLGITHVIFTIMNAMAFPSAVNMVTHRVLVLGSLLGLAYGCLKIRKISFSRT